MYRTTFIIAFANNAAMMALALEYQPYSFAIVAEWVWCGFAMIFLIVFPMERFPLLLKFADMGMLAMNIALTVTGLIGCGNHDI
jgi:hypothetical protein